MVQMRRQCRRSQVFLLSARWPHISPNPLTSDVANQSCLKLFAPRALRSPERELAWSIFALTCHKLRC